MLTKLLSLSPVDIFFLIVLGPLIIAEVSNLIFKMHNRFRDYKRNRQSSKELRKAELRKAFEEKSKEHHKYDGFSDEETRNYAKSLGADNLKQLHLIQQFNAPDYETAKMILSGNFGSYQQLLDAESIGATTETEVHFINKLKAPNFETALKIKQSGFESYAEYQLALAKGASNQDELKLIEKMGTKDYEEALWISSLGFEDGQTYRLALSKGFTDLEGWKKYLKNRNDLIGNYKSMKKDLNKDFIMKELAITDTNELLLMLEKFNVPILGNKILFSYENTAANHDDNGYSEFELNEIVKLDEDQEICKICLEPLVGKIGTCSKCENKLHYDCMSGWILKNKACPTCMEPIQLTEIIFSEQNKQIIKQVECILCHRIINPLQRVIRCDYCFTIYHKTEFLEYAKIKGKCLKCNQTFKF